MEHQNKIKKLFIIKHEENVGYVVFFCGEYLLTRDTKEEAQRQIDNCFAIPQLMGNKIKDIIDKIEANIYMNRSLKMIDEDVRTCFICGACWRGCYNGTKHKQTERHRHNMEILTKIEEMLNATYHDIIEILYLWNDIRGRTRFKSRV